MSPKELSEILLHAIPSVWSNKAYLQGWYFEGNSYKETCDIFKRMKIVEQFCKGVTPSKTTTRWYTNRFSHGMKLKRV